MHCKGSGHSFSFGLDEFNAQPIWHRPACFASPGTGAVETFSVDWHGESNWWGPPPRLIPRVIRHAEKCGAHGTLLLGICPLLAFAIAGW